jgi:hypothetical protein
MRVEEETSTMTQGLVGKSYGNKEGKTNPNPETTSKPEELKTQQ